MALHGSVIVNDHVLGYWTATRTVTRFPDGPHTYACDVCLIDENAHQGERRAKFDLTHMYADGALVLASAVLSHAATMTVPAERQQG